MSGREYVTVAEAAIITHTSERTVRRWMSSRLLAVYRRGDGVLVLKITDLTVVERGQRQAASKPRARLRRDYLALLDRCDGPSSDASA